jgi:hypothetical protein
MTCSMEEKPLPEGYQGRRLRRLWRRASTTRKMNTTKPSAKSTKTAGFWSQTVLIALKISPNRMVNNLHHFAPKGHPPLYRLSRFQHRESAIGSVEITLSNRTPAS